MDVFLFSVFYIVTDCSWKLRFDKKQKGYIKLIHLVTDDGLYGQKAMNKLKKCFYLQSVMMDSIGFTK